MEQRTCNIIMCCKGNCKYVNEEHDARDVLYPVRRYLADECNCPESVYTKELLEGVMFDALCDYINGADNPGYVLWSIRNDGKFYETLSEKIFVMFQLTTVRKGDHERGFVNVNGFTEDQINQSNIELFDL